MARIVLAGPGRAGTALALALRRAGHDIAGVIARRPDAATGAAALLDAAPLSSSEPLPECDLLIVAVRDDAIGAAAAELAHRAGTIGGAVHLSGLSPVDVLDPLADMGPIGSFHPLQTMPTPETGASRLAGAWVAVTTGDEDLRLRLRAMATSIGAVPFDLEDAAKPLYHAAAAASANFPLAALAMAADLFAAAGVPFAAARPLVEAVIANAFDLGPAAALTGPVARGDVGTVVAQLAAVADRAPEWSESFVAWVAELARLTGRESEFEDLT
jgi:predicted short-subunit dehydrogenase-like oxidoreductase (DUF2520 family)